VVPLGGVEVRERAFNAQPWEVRAFLAGQKTQIRRPVKLPSFDRVTHIVLSEGAVDLWDAKDDRGATPAARMVWHSILCPFGVPGDRLWVRETFQLETNQGFGDDYEPPFRDGRPIEWWDGGEGERYWWQPHYRATDPEPELCCERNDCSNEDPHGHWTSSTQMPRWASRLTLEVTDVRVQRLAEISKADAIAEGATRREWAKAPAGWSACGWSVDWSRVGTLSRYAGGIHKRGHEQPLTERDICLGSPQMAFASEWERANGKRAPWDSNPFVWAVSFCVVARG
jgi:hypothetical protein